jgi:flagellar biosynthesis/type III secretory pathway protein FliH
MDKGKAQGIIMKSINLKKLVSVSTLGLITLMGTSLVANAQRNRDDDRHRQDDQRNEQRISQEQQKLDRQRIEAEARRVREEQQRQAQWNRQHRNGEVYIAPSVSQNRYRIYRNGRYYNTDNRGAELLRQAVNQGYQQGFQAGEFDRNGRRRSLWTSNNVYRTGTYGYTSGVDRSQYQYYFQQGFQRGYQDGYNSRNQYGNGGSILGNILGSILNIQTY